MEQPRPLWTVMPGSAAKIVMGTGAPQVWKRNGRFVLYRWDGGRRFRRGREAVAVYATREDRHAWVLATPFQASSGRLRYLSEQRGLAWLVIESFKDVEHVVVVNLACGRAFEVAVDGSNARVMDGALRLDGPDGEAVGVVDLEDVADDATCGVGPR